MIKICSPISIFAMALLSFGSQSSAQNQLKNNEALSSVRRAPELPGEGWIYIECVIEKTSTFAGAQRLSEQHFSPNEVPPLHFAFIEGASDRNFLRKWSPIKEMWIEPVRASREETYKLKISPNEIDYESKGYNLEFDFISLNRLTGKFSERDDGDGIARWTIANCQRGFPNLIDRKF